MSILSALFSPSTATPSARPDEPAERIVIETRTPPAEAGTTELVKEILDETKQLVKVEVELAKTEVIREAMSLQKAAIGFGVAAGAVVYAIGMLLVALALAFYPGPVPALVIAGCLFLIAAIGGFLGWHFLPKKPLPHTRERLETSVKLFKERIA